MPKQNLEGERKPKIKTSLGLPTDGSARIVFESYTAGDDDVLARGSLSFTDPKTMLVSFDEPNPADMIPGKVLKDLAKLGKKIRKVNGIQIDAPAGTSISSASESIGGLARSLNKKVAMEFNGMLFVAKPRPRGKK